MKLKSEGAIDEQTFPSEKRCAGISRRLFIKSYGERVKVDIQSPPLQLFLVASYSAYETELPRVDNGIDTRVTHVIPITFTTFHTFAPLH